MGLGKTVQCLSAIALMMVEEEEAEAIRQGNLDQRENREGRAEGFIFRSLVVCPAMLCRHWEQEVNKFFGQSHPNFNSSPLLRAIRYSGRTKKSQPKLGSEGDSEGGLVLIASYDDVRRDSDGFFSRTIWDVAVVSIVSW